MIRMEFIADIRRRHLVDGESISAIARDLQRSRPTVRQALTTLTEPVDHRQHPPRPKLGEYQALLEHWLALESPFPRRQRRTAKRLFEG